jgi:hypothetical protein
VTVVPERVWRVFPWDPSAREGERFSAGYVPPAQGKGRFDLPGVPGGVLYLAETPEHAVAEMIQHYRGQSVDEAELRIAGHALALVAVALPESIRREIADLCDPALLVRLGVRPDRTASRDRRATQAISAAVHAAGYAGLRWWSALAGDWHTVVLFRDRLDPAPAVGLPEPLGLEHPAVREAASALGIPLARRRLSAAPV